MDQMIAALTAFLEQWIDRVGGSAAEQPLLGQITVADIVVVAIYLGFALETHSLGRRVEARLAPSGVSRTGEAIVHFDLGVWRVPRRHSDTVEAATRSGPDHPSPRHGFAFQPRRFLRLVHAFVPGNACLGIAPRDMGGHDAEQGR